MVRHATGLGKNFEQRRVNVRNLPKRQSSGAPRELENRNNGNFRRASHLRHQKSHSFANGAQSFPARVKESQREEYVVVASNTEENYERPGGRFPVSDHERFVEENWKFLVEQQQQKILLEQQELNHQQGLLIQQSTCKTVSDVLNLGNLKGLMEKPHSVLPFRGKPEERFERWIPNFERIATSNGWNEDHMVAELATALKDSAAKYFGKESAMHAEALSWEEWKRKLKSRYFDSSRKFTAREGLGKRNFIPNGPVEQYYDDILEPTMDADFRMDPDMQVHNLPSGLRMVPLMQTQVAAQCPKSPQ